MDEQETLRQELDSLKTPPTLRNLLLRWHWHRLNGRRGSTFSGASPTEPPSWTLAGILSMSDTELLTVRGFGQRWLRYLREEISLEMPGLAGWVGEG